MGERIILATLLCYGSLSGRSQVCFQAGKLEDFMAGRGVVTALVRGSPQIKCLGRLRNEKESHGIFIALLVAAHFPFSVKVALYFCVVFFQVHVIFSILNWMKSECLCLYSTGLWVSQTAVVLKPPSGEESFPNSQTKDKISEIGKCLWQVRVENTNKSTSCLYFF